MIHDHYNNLLYVTKYCVNLQSTMLALRFLTICFVGYQIQDTLAGGTVLYLEGLARFAILPWLA